MGKRKKSQERLAWFYQSIHYLFNSINTQKRQNFIGTNYSGQLPCPFTVFLLLLPSIHSFLRVKPKFVHKGHVFCCHFCLFVCVCVLFFKQRNPFLLLFCPCRIFVFTQQTQPYLCTTWTLAHDTLTMTVFLFFYYLFSDNMTELAFAFIKHTHAHTHTHSLVRPHTHTVTNTQTHTCSDTHTQSHTMTCWIN